MTYQFSMDGQGPNLVTEAPPASPVSCGAAPMATLSEINTWHVAMVAEGFDWAIVAEATPDGIVLWFPCFEACGHEDEHNAFSAHDDEEGHWDYPGAAIDTPIDLAGLVWTQVVS